MSDERREEFVKRLRAFEPREVGADLVERIGEEIEGDATDSSHADGIAGKISGGVGLRLFGWIGSMAAAALIVLTIILNSGGDGNRDGGDGGGSSVVLAAGWKIEGYGEAKYEVVGPYRVRLDRGEVHLRFSGEAGGSGKEVVIETGAGEARAKGGELLIGTHENPLKGTDMKKLTRVLVLAGVVTLTNSLGNVTGGEGALLAAEDAKSPVKVTLKANSDFAFDLYRQLAKENGGKNMFFSPYSVSNALAMTMEGARGKTAAEMGSVLRFPDVARRVGKDAQLIPWHTSMMHTGLAQLNAKLTGGEKDPAKAAAIRKEIKSLKNELETIKSTMLRLRKAGKWKEMYREGDKGVPITRRIAELNSQLDQYELAVANALWGEQTYPFRKSYINTISKHYGTGGVFPVDFLRNSEVVRKRINGWVEKRTKDRIKDLLPKGSVTRQTRMVLTNAIYFKGEWASPFDTKHTKDRAFTLGSGLKKDVAMMLKRGLKGERYGAFNADGSFFATPVKIRRGERPALYPKAGGFEVAEVSYKGDDLSMVIVLPVEADGLADLEKKLTSENVSRWVGGLKKREMHLHLPKFKLDSSYTLGEAGSPKTLQHMGMRELFTSRADLSGMSASGRPDLYVTQVFHKAFIEVNEKGTEAAAATAVVIGLKSVPITRPFTPEFKADRPFVYMIREKSTGSILFMGRVMDPSLEK